MHNENISAFLDGELDEAEIDEMLEQLAGEDSRAQLRRLSIARAALSGCPPALRNVDLSLTIGNLVAQEPLLASAAGSPRVVALPARGRGRPRWVVPVGGLALAASAVMAALVLQLSPPAGDPVDGQPLAIVDTQPVKRADSPLVASAAPAEEGPAELVISAPTAQSRYTGASTPAARQQLNSYLLNHARYGGGYALSGPLGYARVAAHGGESGSRAER